MPRGKKKEQIKKQIAYEKNKRMEREVIKIQAQIAAYKLQGISDANLELRLHSLKERIRKNKNFL